MSTAAIAFTEVRKSYNGKLAIDGLSFRVEPGECFGLLGPNGAGKSTTARMVLGMAMPDAGTITVLNEPVPLRARAARARIGVVPQFDNLEPGFTVRENLQVFGRYFGMSPTQIEAVIPSLLEFAHLESKAHTRVTELSGGMKRRLTIARALINDPQLLVMDEPVTGLDPHARHLVWERLRSLLADGKTILLTTHFMEEAERLCDRLCIIDKGCSIAQGAPRELIAEKIGSHVLEIYGGNSHELGAFLQPYVQRIEVCGEALFCYIADLEQVRFQLRKHTGLRILQRPANLEDVFLRLTGREIKDW